MAVTYQIRQAANLLQYTLKAYLDGASIAYTGVPFTIAAEQYSFDGSDLPMVLIEVGRVPIVRSVKQAEISVMFTIHRVVPMSADGNAEMDALDVLCGFAAHLEADYTLGGNVQRIEPGGFLIGADNLLQSALNQSDQTGIGVVSLPVSMTWIENRLS